MMIEAAPGIELKHFISQAEDVLGKIKSR
jgi:hypothetical protein